MRNLVPVGSYIPMNQARKQKILAHFANDTFAQHIGATLEEVREGYSRVSLTVAEHHLNFHATAHGGLLFSLGDVAFAAASNSRGQTAVALNVSVNFIKPAFAGDLLVAEAQEQHLEGRVGVYDIVVTATNRAEIVAKSQAVVYRKRDMFVP